VDREPHPAVGVKCACPDREVICVTGDAGFFYHLSELETARRYGLKVIVVVNNNTSMNQEAFFWDAGSPAQEKNWQFHDADLAQIARGFGCHGRGWTTPPTSPQHWTRPGQPSCRR
jgi:acetolactate synthase I/II/III large subunit